MTDKLAPSLPPVEAQLRQLVHKWRFNAIVVGQSGVDLDNRCDVQIADAYSTCAAALESVVEAMPPVGVQLLADAEMVLSNVESFLKHMEWNDRASEETAGDALEEIRQIRARLTNAAIEALPHPQGLTEHDLALVVSALQQDDAIGCADFVRITGILALPHP